MFLRPFLAITFAAAVAAAQEPASAGGEFVIRSGTKVPLSLINSISTKTSHEGDRVYLETAFPILANGRIVIPVGSWVAGTVTQVKRPGRAKGRGELYIRFDNLTLPNGITRDFRSRMGGMDAQASGELDRDEGKVRSESNKSGDAKTVAETTAAGTSVGAIAGNAAGHGAMGMGIGAAAGAVGGLIYTLVSRGPDAVIAKGATIEMVLDRELTFHETELNFSVQPQRKDAPPAETPGKAGAGG